MTARSTDTSSLNARQREILATARKLIGVADGRKFRRSAPVRIGDISRLDCFVTDRPPPGFFLRSCRRHGVRLEVTRAHAAVAVPARGQVDESRAPQHGD